MLILRRPRRLLWSSVHQSHRNITSLRIKSSIKCSREQIGIKRAKVRCAPRRPLKVIAPRIKLAKVRCAPHRSQKGHRSAGGANVLKLVARGPGPKLLKFKLAKTKIYINKKMTGSKHFNEEQYG